MPCAWITSPRCRLHEMGDDHPESPSRLDVIADHLLATGLMSLMAPYEAPPATTEQLMRAHTARHVLETLASAPAEGYLHLDADTAINPCSIEAALHATGAAVLATDIVVAKEVRSAFCAVRPPGHHATRDASQGFCIFNNVAVGIRHALAVHGIERIALADFDVHHGNGSEDIFAGDERVLMVSTFRKGIYPFNGEMPLGPNMVNVPLERGATGDALKRAFEEAWLPRLEAFRPQMLYISAGFDGHRGDDMGGLAWFDQDYAWITRRLVEVAALYCGGRIVSCLEGGYELSLLGRSVGAHVKALVE